MAPKSQQKKTTQQQQRPVTSAASGPPKQMTDYTAFETEKLSVSVPYKTKYNAQAKLKYSGDDLLLRTPFLKRCFLNKFETGPAQLTLSMSYEGESFHDTLSELQSEVLNRLTDKLLDNPLDNKRKHDEAADPAALRADLEQRLKPLLVNDNPEYPEKLRSEIHVVKPDTKKLSEAVDCKIFLTELDGTNKPITLVDMADLLDDRQFFYQVRAVLHFTHVYLGNSKGKQDIGIKHNIKAVQLKRVELADKQQDEEPIVLDAQDFLA